MEGVRPLIVAEKPDGSLGDLKGKFNKVSFELSGQGGRTLVRSITMSFRHISFGVVQTEGQQGEELPVKEPYTFIEYQVAYKHLSERVRELEGSVRKYKSESIECEAEDE